MPRCFITPPDVEYDRSIPRVLIKNCDWSGEQIQYLLENLKEKQYDVYLYHDNINDVQWFEGVRAMTLPKRVYDCNHYKDVEPIVLMRKIDDEF
jgi:hypothetical protein